MAAALACLQELVRIDAPAHIQATGQRLLDGLVDIAARHGHTLKVSGMPSMPYLRTEHQAGIAFHQALCGECASRGLFLTSHHNLFISAAHSDDDVDRCWEIFDVALANTRIRQALKPDRGVTRS